MTPSASRYVLPCAYCRSTLHTTDYCPKTWGGQINRAQLRCAYCGARDHNRDACPKAWPGSEPVVIHDEWYKP